MKTKRGARILAEFESQGGFWMVAGETKTRARIQEVRESRRHRQERKHLGVS